MSEKSQKQLSTDDCVDSDSFELTPMADEGIERGDLTKYISAQPKTLEIKQNVRINTEPNQPQNLLIKMETDARKKSAEYIKKKKILEERRLQKDAYFNKLEEFSDDTLKVVANKIAEKRSIEMETSNYKSEIAKLKEQVKKDEHEHKNLIRLIETEKEICRKNEADTRDLEEILASLNYKILAKKEELSIETEKIQKIWNEEYKNLEEARQRLINAKNRYEDEKVNIKHNVKRLDHEHNIAYENLVDLKKSLSQAKSNEQERVKMLRQKAKILVSLIGKENSNGKSALHNEIVKILKSPTRNAMLATQSVFSKSK